LRGLGIAGLALAAGTIAAAAQDMKAPRISPTHVDWDAVAVEMMLESRTGQLPADAQVPRTPLPAELMASLNRATGERFAKIHTSPIPVLLPFDTTAFLHDKADKAADAAAEATPAPSYPSNYLLGFNSVPFFYPGPAGYDAVVVARAQEMRELGIGLAEPIYIHVGGSALVYELDEPAGMIGWPVKGLDEIPGIRRVYLENHVRYTFVRYGVPYVVDLECYEGGSRFRKPSCRDADKVAVRFLKSLRVVGGTPVPQPDTVNAGTIDRPTEQSTVFT
jgi:hypothetical protein